MKIFNKYHEKRTANDWYFQWGCLTRYEKQVLSIEFNFPTPSDKSLFFGFTIFTFTLIFFEIAKCDPKELTRSLSGEIKEGFESLTESREG